jgi:hypothetical protein
MILINTSFRNVSGSVERNSKVSSERFKIGIDQANSEEMMSRLNGESHACSGHAVKRHSETQLMKMPAF